MISNGTFIIYNQIPLPVEERDPEGRGFLNLMDIREFNRIDLG
jgi:hypothetical protein